MASTLFILDEAPYGSECAYNALGLAAALAGKVLVFEQSLPLPINPSRHPLFTIKCRV